MSEIDFVEARNLHASNAMNAFTIFITLTFSYLTVVYIVGTKLLKVQLVLLSLLYFFWAIAFVLVAITHLQSLEAFLEEYPDFVRSRVWSLPWTYFGSTITLGGILISGYFVYNVRRNSSGFEFECGISKLAYTRA